MAIEGPLVVTIDDLVIETICAQVRQHFASNGAVGPVSAFQDELRARLELKRNHNLDLFKMVMTIIAGIQRVLFELEPEMPPHAQRVDFDAGPPEYFRATAELSFRLRQSLFPYSHREEART